MAYRFRRMVALGSALSLLGVLLAACGGAAMTTTPGVYSAAAARPAVGAPATPTTSPAPAIGAEAAGANATHQVMIENFRFSPATLTVSTGTTVTWTNHDNFIHSVHLLTGGTETKNLPIGESAQITFAKPGTYYYECSYHPSLMHGEVIVQQGSR